MRIPIEPAVPPVLGLAPLFGWALVLLTLWPH